MDANQRPHEYHAVSAAGVAFIWCKFCGMTPFQNQGPPALPFCVAGQVPNDVRVGGQIIPQQIAIESLKNTENRIGVNAFKNIVNHDQLKISDVLGADGPGQTISADTIGRIVNPKAQMPGTYRGWPILSDTSLLTSMCKGQWAKTAGKENAFSFDAAFTSCSDLSDVIHTWDQLLCRFSELGEILDLLFGNSKFSVLFSKAIKTLRQISSAGAPPVLFAEQKVRQAFVEYGVFVRSGLKSLPELADAEDRIWGFGGAAGKLQLEDDLRQFLLVEPTLHAKRPAESAAEQQLNKRGGGKAAAVSPVPPGQGKADKENPCITHYSAIALRSSACAYGSTCKFAHIPVVLLKKSSFVNTAHFVLTEKSKLDAFLKWVDVKFSTIIKNNNVHESARKRNKVL